MTATNHVLTGIVLAGIIKQPYLALPAAFVSHFVCDALPHFGFVGQRGFGNSLKHKITYVMLAFDAVTWPFAIYLGVKAGWFALLAGLIAASPDILWVHRYFFIERRGKVPKENWFTNFHKKIQQFERPWGIVVEFAWFGLFAYLITGALK